MKKVLTLVLALAMVMSCTSAFAAMHMSNLKVEIDEALKAYAALYDEKNGTSTTIESHGGGEDYAGTLKAALQAGNMPDIFVIEGQGGYDVWAEYILDVSDQEFAKNTGVGFTYDGKTYGFPVAIEGFGLAYNADILAAAEIDPATLTNRKALQAAFEKLDGMKEELGIDAVVSMATSVAGGMTWVTGNQMFSAYLSAGLPYGDMTIINKALAGEVDMDRLAEFGEYTALLFQYADNEVLVNGDYDDQLNLFATGKAAFIHQGNWIDPNLVSLGVMDSLNLGFIGEPFLADTDLPGLMVSAPSWYVVNSQSENIEEALTFLNAMVTTEEGQNYMVNEAGMVPAFGNVTLEPAGDLSKAVMAANAAGEIYSWGFGYLPDGFGQNQLGPIFELLAQGAIDAATWTEMVAAEIANIPNL